MKSPPRFQLCAAALFALLALEPACGKHEKSSAAASASAAPSARATATPVPERPKWHAPAPSGPVLAILAGKGVGAIRIGATVATIERQMQKKCDRVTAKQCRYIDRAVVFDLDGGKVTTIRVQRPGRPAGRGPDGREQRYGIFNGAIPPDIRAGMMPWAVQRVLGPPLKVDKRDGSGPDHVVEVAQYNGMTLSYDKLPNGKLALGEIAIHK